MPSVWPKSGSLALPAIRADTSRPIAMIATVVYGVPDNLAMYSDDGNSFSVSANVPSFLPALVGHWVVPARCTGDTGCPP